ncbi:hypothetical protein LCGC14_2038630 [marine sediment metagenome]|uniref:Uncharacterized protein n=1 Tax=marine sediment metagenome TaxID=412755 RepID=A0A0F9H602_9ZZZZ
MERRDFLGAMLAVFTGHLLPRPVHETVCVTKRCDPTPVTIEDISHRAVEKQRSTGYVIVQILSPTGELRKTVRVPVC